MTKQAEDGVILHDLLCELRRANRAQCFGAGIPWDDEYRLVQRGIRHYRHWMLRFAIERRKELRRKAKAARRKR